MIALALALLFGVIGYVRGRGLIPAAGHVVAAIAWGTATIAASWALNYSGAYIAAIGAVVAVGTLIWLVGLIPGWGGWGLYFAAWTWVWNPNEVEVPPIDWIGKKLVPFKTMAPHWTNGLRGIICMSLRGLYILPLFFMLSALPLGIIVGLTQGLIYGAVRWLAPHGQGNVYAEPIYAFIIGSAVGYKLTVGF